jgi:formamidopyrimidine-DNA glycosylase
MPELPEVETVVRELKSLIIGKEILSITPLWLKSFDQKSKTKITGQNVEKISRQGKYIIMHLTGSYLIVHLRMTGQMLFKNDNTKVVDPHIRVLIQFTDDTALHFKDTRKFGRIYHVDHPESVLQKVGIDALDPNLKEEWFVSALKKSRMNIKALLLSQRLLSGIGNIYADESLFRSGIHPGSIAARIPGNLMISLFNNIRDVLTSAVENMGSTISDYRDSYGNKGNNQNFLKVYQRNGKPCEKCGRPILKVRMAGRGTHFCNKCQKIYS